LFPFLFTFVSLSEEEIGSAGEQPIRNKIINGNIFPYFEPSYGTAFEFF